MCYHHLKLRLAKKNKQQQNLLLLRIQKNIIVVICITCVSLIQ